MMLFGIIAPFPHVISMKANTESYCLSDMLFNLTVHKDALRSLILKQVGLFYDVWLLHAVFSHLMVPVGEGRGEPNALMCSSCCCIVGMLILIGDMCGTRGRFGRSGCSLSLCSSGSRSDVNWILITVLGKRKTHLENRMGRAGEKQSNQ